MIRTLLPKNRAQWLRLAKALWVCIGPSQWVLLVLAGLLAIRGDILPAVIAGVLSQALPVVAARLVPLCEEKADGWY